MAGGLLSKDRIVAKPDFNRWLISPAVVAIEASIGQIYAFSVFNLRLTRLILGFFVNRAVTSVDDDRYMDDAVPG